MKMILLGYRQGLRANRWKDEVAEAGTALGWDVEHIDARGADICHVVDRCKDADLFVWCRTHGHDPDGDARLMLVMIEELGVPTVGIHMDLYWGLSVREPRIAAEDQPWWFCNYVFTADGGNQERFRNLGVNHVWMPPAMGVRFHQKSKPDSTLRRNYKAVFVGSNVRNIHSTHRGRLIDWAKKKFGKEFRHYGISKKIYGPDLNRLYSSARFILGDSAPADYYWSDRVPMTMGRGGVLAYPHTPGLEEQGFNEENLILYDRFEFGKLGDILDSMTDKERDEMSDAAFALIGERHLWTHRLQEIQRTVFG